MKLYEDHTVAELQDLLRMRDLPVSGTKPELTARLQQDDAARDVAAAADVDVDVVRVAVAEAVAQEHRPGECVVDDGTPHMGRAVPGTVVCSRHTNRYANDGTPRAEKNFVEAA